jgi:metal-responsive CopG/Arc/MetJ family transcriptional regulator
MMATIEIDDDLALELEAIAAREGQTAGAIIKSLVQEYISQHGQIKPTPEALEAFIGMFDDDVTDLSTTVRETMDAYYRKKYGNSD